MHRSGYVQLFAWLVRYQLYYSGLFHDVWQRGQLYRPGYLQLSFGLDGAGLPYSTLRAKLREWRTVRSAQHMQLSSWVLGP